MLKVDFNKITLDYPRLSSFICYVKAVKDKHYSAHMLTRNLNKLVDKEDYDEEDKDEIKHWLKTI